MLVRRRAVLLDETGQRGMAAPEPGTRRRGRRAAIGNHARLRERDRPHRVVPDLVMLTAGGLGADTGPILTAALAAAGIDTEVRVAGDVMSAYFSATANPTGYLVLSGTGAISARIVDGELAGLADGIGWLLGDEGSGFMIGHRVVRAAAADGGPGTVDALPLVLVVVTRWTPTTYDALRSGADAARLREAARRVLTCSSLRAADGDAVALTILDDAVTGLLASCGSLIADDEHPVVLAGGLLHDGSPLSDALKARYPGRCLRAHDGTAGAALLALRALGVTADTTSLTRIHETLTPLLG